MLNSADCGVDAEVLPLVVGHAVLRQPDERSPVHRDCTKRNRATDDMSWCLERCEVVRLMANAWSVAVLIFT